MVRIIVVSDTHMPHMASELPSGFIEDLKQSDMCIHAGDVVEENVLNLINTHCPCKIVAGNMDSTAIQKKYPTKLILEVEDVKIGVTHGSGSPNGLASRACEMFDDTNIDICIYGHSHKVNEELINGVLCLNPGSLCDYLYAEFNSYLVLQIEGKNFEYAIVKV